MPQSLDKTLIHIVFSTKYREPTISLEVKPRLHAYLATVCRNAGCFCYRVGGVEDHVHLLIGLSRTITIASLVEELKTTSSKWMKLQSPELSAFAWQRGYGVFSVDQNSQARVIAYIDNQEQHHRSTSFQDEYRRVLADHDLAYDERYVWD